MGIWVCRDLESLVPYSRVRSKPQNLGFPRGVHRVLLEGLDSRSKVTTKSACSKMAGGIERKSKLRRS